MVYLSYIGLWFQAKKGGLPMNYFCKLWVSLPGGRKYFCKYHRKNYNILGFWTGAKVLSIHEKTRVKKSNASVPLNWSKLNIHVHLWELVWEDRSVTFRTIIFRTYLYISWYLKRIKLLKCCLPWRNLLLRTSWLLLKKHSRFSCPLLS